MNRSEKAKEIGIILDRLYPNPPIPLEHNSAYTLLVAVMLSAQTTDKMVNKVTPQLFKKANTPELMATLEVETIQKLIQKIGLAPTKAKNLKKMAQQLIDGGGVQSDWKYLESLAGVGHKTASVVMSQWYGIPAFPVDTHIHRLASRWGLSRAKNVDMTERDLKKLWTEEKWNLRHLQIIFFGREYCPAQNHDLKKCLICSWSASKKRQREEMNVK
ncbi:MAG: endonuclease III [Candidatus Marinimicrobia bacterium]|jgi:endonuclease-3|nr:endonuclease III [Candidatus Neomarinimicrobiota bacterium]MBT7424277.1 endonuclease III [Candidatus Neomarinimicrobiota bacterium]|tara:strand:- start:414 stop:1061 length:648 start_codon:yes stop_codon:yes gene_type:complete